MAANDGSSGVDLVKEFSLLPVVYEILKSLEKTNDSQEVTRKVAAFREKIQSCREILDRVPGLDSNVETQKKELESYQQKYKEKCELLERYKTLRLFTEALSTLGE